METPLVQHVYCKSAPEFLDALSPRGRYFGSYARHQKEWVFRGHGNDTFRLVPKALRCHELRELYALAQIRLDQPDHMHLNKWQVRAEIEVVERFIRRCDEHGLKVPGYGAQLQETLRTPNQRLKAGSEVLTNWPYEAVHPALCLAQHYGLPTRLLDWSYSQFKAAHFAAKDAEQRVQDGQSRIAHDNADSQQKSFSVWALRASALECMSPISPSMSQNRVDLVQVPRCDNLYLHAQEGLFTLCRASAFQDGETVDRRPLDEQIESFEMRPPYGFRDRPVLYHFTLNQTEANACLAGLEREGITAAALFPDYGGVVKSLRAEASNAE